MRLKSIDQILLIFLFFVGTASTVMLFSREESSSNLDSIAVIVSEINTVKRKANLFDSWRDLSRGDTLQENDQIYTHDRSEVELLFKSGKTIQLLENSLLKVSKEEDRESLKLEKGVIEANFKQKENDLPLKIDLKGKTVLLESSTGVVQMESTASGGRIFVQSGELTINDGNKSTIVKENQAITQEKNGELGKVVDVFYLLEKPAQKWKILKYAEDSGIPVSFQWKENAKIASNILGQYSHQLLIATTYDFKNVYHSVALPEESGVTDLNFLESGKYFWKIRSIHLTNKEIIESSMRTFEIVPVSASFITNTQNIFVKKENASLKIQWKNPLLNWTTSQKMILRSKGEVIREFVLDKKKESATLSFNEDLINIGAYEVVIETELTDQDKKSLTKESSPFGFKIIENQIPVIKIRNPKKETIFSYKRQGMQKLLTWDVLFGIGSYEVSLLKNNVPVFNSKTSETYMDLPLLEEGVYQWKVRSLDSENRLGEEHSGVINLKFPKRLNSLPKSGEVVFLETPDQEVQFKWEKNSKATSFIFELSEGQEFNQLTLSDETTKNFYGARLGKSGNFYWRVKMKVGDSVEYSEPVSVEVKPAPIFEKPIIQEEIKLQLQKMETNLKVPGTFKFVLKVIEKLFAETLAQEEVSYKVEWELKSFKNVKSYVVEIYRDREMREIVLKEEVPTAHFVWKKAVAGTFYWRLAYRDSWDRITEFSNLSKLVIEAIEEMKPVVEIEESLELISPRHREEFKAPEDLQNFFRAGWVIDPKKKVSEPQMEVLFSYDLNFTQVFLRKKATLKNDEVLGRLVCSDFNENFLAGKEVIELYWRMKNINTNIESKRRFLILNMKDICPDFFKKEQEAQEEVPKENSKEERLEKVPEEIKTSFSLGLSPALINIKTKGSSYEARANGMSILSFDVMGEKVFDKDSNLYSFYGNLNYLSGKIFTDEKLQNISLEMGARLKRYLKLGATYKMSTELQEVNQNKIVGESASLFGLSSTLEYLLSDFKIGLNLQAGNFLGYSLELQKETTIKKYPLIFGAFYRGISFESEERKSNGSVIGLKIHYRFE